MGAAVADAPTDAVPYLNNYLYDGARCEKCSGADDSLVRREIPIGINGEDRTFRFSPHCLFPQHFIFCPNEHKQGAADMQTYVRLLDAAECFKHYFFAKNADIAGLCEYDDGHECFTGGLPTLPLFSAEPRLLFDDPGGYVRISVLDWYNTVILLENAQRHAILGMIERIENGWQSFSDKALGIKNKPADKNNGISPVAHISDGEYCVYLILRNNKLPHGGKLPRSNKADNVPPQSGIGVLESLGAFTLPWTGAIKDMAAKAKDEAAQKAVESFIETACENALAETAVFKDDGAGNMGLITFMTNLGLSIKR